jgi:hypothetical protein
MKIKSGTLALVLVACLTFLGQARAADPMSSVLPGVGGGRLFIGETMDQAAAAMDAFYGGHYISPDNMVCSNEANNAGEPYYCVDDSNADLTAHTGKVTFIFITDPAAWVVLWQGKPVQVGDTLTNEVSKELVANFSCANMAIPVPGSTPPLALVSWDGMAVYMLLDITDPMYSGGSEPAKVYGWVVTVADDKAEWITNCDDYPTGGN